MATLPGEALADPRRRRMAQAGMEVARIHCAHDHPAAWAGTAANVQAAALVAAGEVLVSMDLPGPELRTGPSHTGGRQRRSGR